MHSAHDRTATLLLALSGAFVIPGCTTQSDNGGSSGGGTGAGTSNGGTAADGGGTSPEGGTESPGEGGTESPTDGGQETGLECSDTQDSAGVCQVFTAKYLECYPELTPERDAYLAYCEMTLDLYECYYGAECRQGMEDFFACLSRASCAEIMADIACPTELAAAETACGVEADERKLPRGLRRR